MALAELVRDPKPLYLVSDDHKARSMFPSFRFVWTEELIDYLRSRDLIGEALHTSLLDQLGRSTFYSRSHRHGIESPHRKSL